MGNMQQKFIKLIMDEIKEYFISFHIYFKKKFNWENIKKPLKVKMFLKADFWLRE